MDLGKLAKFFNELGPTEVRRLADAIREINTFKMVCIAKGVAEIDKRSLRIKILRKTADTEKLREMIRKTGIADAIVEDEKDGHTKPKKPIRR